MNTLIAVGTAAAFLYSLFVTVAPGLLPEDLRDVYYEAVGVILTLIILGRLLEARAKVGTGEAIRKLIGLQAKTARVVRDGEEREVPVEELALTGRTPEAGWTSGELPTSATARALRLRPSRASALRSRSGS